MLCERACRPRAVDVDTALATCSFLAMHVLHNDRVSNRFDVVGFYDFELVREQAGRRVHKFTATKDHGFGNPNIFRIAAGGRAGGRADTTNPMSTSPTWRPWHENT